MRNRIIIGAIIAILAIGNVYFYKRWQRSSLLARLIKADYSNYRADIKKKMVIIEEYLDVSRQEHYELLRLKGVNEEMEWDIQDAKSSADQAAIDAREAADAAEEAKSEIENLKDELEDAK